jgi:hypothetical protein
MISLALSQGGPQRTRPAWTKVAAPLASFALSTGLTLFSIATAHAAGPIIAPVEGDSEQPVFTSAGDELCVPAKPLVTQQDGPARSGDGPISLAFQSQLSDAHSNIFLTSASDSALEMQGTNVPPPLCDAAPAHSWSWLDTLELFGGLEGSKQPQDFGVNAEFGGRLHVNWGAPLLPAWGIGVQIGTAVDLTDNAVQVFERLEGNSDRVQEFTTVGIFQRIGALNWAVVYDFLEESYYDHFNLGQVRARLGYHITQCDEIGAWGTIATEKDNGTFADIPLTLRPIDQASAFWRHTWENCSQTTLWVGGCPGHGQVNLALGDLPPVGPRVVFGADLHIPLSDHWAIFGEANFFTPANSGTVDAYLGFCYYIGGTAHGFRERQFSPVLPVADDTDFAVDLNRR